MNYELPEFAESINMHGNRMSYESAYRQKKRVCRKQSKLVTCLNILLVIMCICVALMCISIAMAGFSFCTMKLAQILAL